MSEQNDPGIRLTKLAGFDPAKKPKMTNALLKEVLDELQETREQQAKERARSLLQKAIELREGMVKAEKEFNSQKQKFDKELGKILNQLESDLNRSSQAPGGDPAPEAAAVTE